MAGGLSLLYPTVNGSELLLLRVIIVFFRRLRNTKRAATPAMTATTATTMPPMAPPDRPLLDLISGAVAGVASMVG